MAETRELGAATVPTRQRRLRVARRARLAWLGIVAGCAALTIAAGPGEPVSVERQLGVMGTTLAIELEASTRERALAASEQVVQAIEATERRLSTWRDDSELARLNGAAIGVRVELSGELAAELAAVERCSLQTAGGFDARVGPLVAAWGLRVGGRQPSAAELARALRASAPRSFELGPGWAVRRDAAAWLEEGGFGKGAGLDAALRALAAADSSFALLDLGGQVAVLGSSSRETIVAVADPRQRARQALSLRISSGSIATSGNSERGIQVAGVRRGHILDPRSGEPAADFGSITVWASSALEADCLATGLYALGADAALGRAATLDGVEVLVLEPVGAGLRARATPGLAERIVELAPGVELGPGVARAGPP